MGAASQPERIAAAKAHGRSKGRPPSINPVRIGKLAETMGPTAIAKHLEVARSSVYRVLAPN